MTQKQQRGTGWQNLGFCIAGFAFWGVVIIGAPVLVQFLYGMVESWLPR